MLSFQLLHTGDECGRVRGCRGQCVVQLLRETHSHRGGNITQRVHASQDAHDAHDAPLTAPE